MQHEKIIQKSLWNFGVNRKYRGFDQVVYGVELSMPDIGRLEHITKDLYPDIAKRFCTSTECVERNIRTLKEIIWEYGNRELLKEIGDISERPTCTRFLEVLTKHLLSLYEKPTDI